MTSAFFDANEVQESGAGTSAADTEHADPVPARRKRAAPKDSRLARAASLQTIASLLWIPQAGAIAHAVGAIADGQGLPAVFWPAIIVFIFGGIKTCLDAAGGRMAFRAARSQLTRRRQMATAALAARSPIDIARPASGLAASVLGEQAETIVPYLARFQPARMKTVAAPLLILLCVFPFSWLAAIILLIAAPLIPLFMALIGWRAKAASEQQLAETGGLNAFLLDRLRGLATIRALDAVDITAKRLRADADSLRERTMAVLRVAFLSSAVLELFSALGVAMVAVYVGFSLLGQIGLGSWASGLSLTEGLFILLLAPAFFEPLRELSAVWHDRAAGEAALEAMEALSSGDLAVPGAEDEITLSEASSRQALPVRLEETSFRYGEGRPFVLDRFNLDVEAGEHVALLGVSGSGKSTILSLLAGLAQPASGRVILGDMDLAVQNAASLRGGIAWLGQRPHIFAGTILSNIGLGRREIGRGEIAEAIDFAKLGHVVDAYGTRPIGEGGIGLSGGEAIRLALARAAATRGAGILLADEPTAHLDAATADEITESLLALAKGRTLIVATHDPVLAARMHRVIRLGEEKQEAAA